MNSQPLVCWTEMDLSSKVPPNTKCNIKILNLSPDKAIHAGVRRKGSSLNRKTVLPPKTSKQMSVTTDNNSKIEIYTEDKQNIRFEIEV